MSWRLAARSFDGDPNRRRWLENASLTCKAQVSGSPSPDILAAGRWPLKTWPGATWQPPGPLLLWERERIEFGLLQGCVSECLCVVDASKKLHKQLSCCFLHQASAL